jgi:hypothetical protein
MLETEGPLFATLLRASHANVATRAAVKANAIHRRRVVMLHLLFCSNRYVVMMAGGRLVWR